MANDKNHKKNSVFRFTLALPECSIIIKGLNKAFSFLVVLLLISALLKAQTSENNLGVVSEIVMSSECLTKPNYNLFFESNVSAKETEKSTYWYKLAFSKDCFIKLTLIPNDENDRYTITLYSSKRNENFCDDHEKIENIEESVTFNDTQQPATFRESVFYSKVIEVFDNEAIYIFINHNTGKDSGHVIEIQTCDDYSYILKVNKPTEQLDCTADYTQSSGLDIHKKICDVNDSAHFGYVSFNNNEIAVNNLTRNRIDSINTAYSKSLIAIKAQINETVYETSDTLKNHLSANKTNLKSSTKDSSSGDFFKIFHKISNNNGISYKLVDAYSNYLQIAETAIPADKKNLQPAKVGLRTKRTAKKNSKLVPINFIAIDIETGIVLKQSAFKLLREPGLRSLPYTYNDSIGMFMIEIETDETYRIECDLIGYKNYAQQLDIKNRIVIDTIATYIIPLHPLKAGDKFVIPNIYFYPNAPAFKEPSMEELNKLVKYMNNNNMNILIAGHTNGNKHISKDKQQTDKSLIFSGSAKKLSKKRAEAVRDYLVKSGIDKNRITVKGYGGKKPIIEEPKNKKEGEKNMRVEIFITKS